MEKNNIRKIIFLLNIICSVFVASIINQDKVDAVNVGGTVITVGSANAVSCASGGRCYTIGTGGMRVTLLDSNGNKKAGPIDYWYTDNKIPFYYAKGSGDNTYVVTFKKKYIKQELENSTPELSVTSFSNFDFFKENKGSKGYAYIISRLDEITPDGEYNKSDPDTRLGEKICAADAVVNQKKGILACSSEKFCWGAANLPDSNYWIPQFGQNEDYCMYSPDPADKKINYNNGEIEKGYVSKYVWSGYYVRAADKRNTRKPNYTYTAINRIGANAVLSGVYDGQANFNSNKSLYLKNIVERDMGKNLVAGEYLQFEPIVQWGSRKNASSCTYGDAIFIGTVSEFSYFINDMVKTLNYGTSSYFNTMKSGTNYDSYSAASYDCAFAFHNATTYYQIATFGIGAKDAKYIPTIDNKGSKLFYTIDTSKFNFNEEDYTRANTIINDKRKSYGVAFLKILPEMVNNCSTTATNYISKNGNSSTLKGLKDELSKAKITSDYSWIDKYKDYGFKNLKELGTYLSNKTDKSCPKPSCDETGKRLADAKLSGKKIKSNLQSLGYDTTDGGSGDAENLDAYSVGLYNNKNDLCGMQTCNGLLKANKITSKTEKNLRAISSLYPDNDDYSLLDYDLVKELGIEPKCGGVSECKTDSAIPRCDEGLNSFTFKDAEVKVTTKGSDCDYTKYAYNYVYPGKKNAAKASIQTSVDTTYGPGGYCREEVSFDFPLHVTKVTGGTIMKWGIDNSKENNSFGTMTVKRTCYIDSKNLSETEKKNGFIIKSTWANVRGGAMDPTATNGRINPKILMNYREPVQKGQTARTLKDVEMETYLSKFTMTINSEKSSDTAESYYNANGVLDKTKSKSFANGKNTTNYREFRCGSDCGTIVNVEMIGTYQIVYPNNLKWYSDSSDNFKKKDATEVEKKGVAEAKYVALGYGLPTSFLTPNSYNTWYGAGSDDESGGYMYVDLSQVGTRNNNGSYHFDKYIKYYVDGAYKYGESFGNGSNIKYSCNYKIENILYDYECPDGKCGKKEEPNCKSLYGRTICGVNRTPKGIDVVFRTVELINDEKEMGLAFPGRSGNGTRKHGQNWDTILGFELDNDTIADILSKKIYSSTPKYEIELTSPMIQDIRKKNKNNSYTSMSDYIFASTVYGGDDSDEKHKYWRGSGEDIYDTINKQCDSLGIKYCTRGKIAFHIYAESSSGDTHSVTYTYAASPFLSDLISKGKLTGACTKEADTKKRAANFSDTLGC